jgi:hypothetical protein
MPVTFEKVRPMALSMDNVGFRIRASRVATRFVD